MKIISIAGATSKAGKTLLAEQIIHFCAGIHHPVYAIKFTTTSDVPSPCPRGAPCTVCDLSDHFRIIRDRTTLMQPGKNTARLALAGADEVLWVIARRSQLPNAWKHTLTHIPENALLIMEGSTVTELCKPDLLFYIYAGHIPRSKWKDSADSILARSDIVVVNRVAGRNRAPAVALPPGALEVDLAGTPATQLPQIRAKISLVVATLVDELKQNEIHHS